ncbi:MAG: hypothetical protein AAGU05_10595, partial [Anaerolineaceae bacterium]
MQRGFSKPNEEGLSNKEQQSFSQIISKMVVMSRLQDLLAWGRKNSLWPFNFG